MDTCNGLRDLSTMVALYRFPRDIESLRATRALLAHDAKEYIDLMGPYMGSADETEATGEAGFSRRLIDLLDRERLSVCIVVVPRLNGGTFR